MSETTGKFKIFRKVNAKCQIKGCRSNGRKTDTYYVSASEGYGPSVVLCKDCIESLYERLVGKKDSGDAELEKKLEAALTENEQLKAELEKVKEENKEFSNLLKTPADDEADAENLSDGDDDTALYTKEEDAEIEADDEKQTSTVLVTEEPAEEVESTAPAEEAVDKAPEKTKKARSKKADA